MLKNEIASLVALLMPLVSPLTHFTSSVVATLGEDMAGLSGLANSVTSATMAAVSPAGNVLSGLM